MQRTSLAPAILLVIAAFAFLFLSVRAYTPADDGDPHLRLLPPDKVQHAPDWTLADVATGRPVRLAEQAQKQPVVFSFWASWCGPCREELPHLERMSRKYRGRVAFYGVNSDDPPQTITRFAQQTGLTFAQLSDSRRDAATRYGAESLPMLFVVDTHDHVRAVSNGYDGDGEGYEAAMSKVLDALLAAR